MVKEESREKPFSQWGCRQHLFKLRCLWRHPRQWNHPFDVCKWNETRNSGSYIAPCLSETSRGEKKAIKLWEVEKKVPKPI
jgi:hypothetical protein